MANLEQLMTTVRESTQCAPAYWGCMTDYHCRTELRSGFGRTLSLPSKIQFEGEMCEKSWQFQELYQCVASRSFTNANSVPAPTQPWPRWNMARCFARDKVPPPTCAAISANLFSPNGRCRGADSLTIETAAAYTCPLDCATGLTDYWYYCATSYGSYMQTQMTYEERAVWYTVIDWDPTSPGPCDAVLHEYVGSRLLEVEQGPCAVAYDNCVGGANDGWCTANLRDAVLALQSPEYARANFEQTMCSKSRDFQYLYQCLRENGVGDAGNTVTPWRATTCLEPDKLMSTQCQVLFDRIPSVCPTPAGGEWTPRAAAGYACSPDCARALFTAADECQSSYGRFVDANYGPQGFFSLWVLMNHGPVRPGSCYTARREAVGDRIAVIAEDEQCAPLYSACFEDIECQPVIREAFEAMGYGPSRILFESKLCEKPWAYQQVSHGLQLQSLWIVPTAAAVS